ncbi:MAG: hypothetical protein II397_10315 [Treponema sp.]|nr:hypothetical protein [Treponema sp.]
MELKKNPKADLEKRRGLYLEIGLVVILAATLVAFEVKSYDSEEETAFQREVIEEVEEQIIQTDITEPPPPPPPPQDAIRSESAKTNNKSIKTSSFFICQPPFPPRK